MPSTLARIRFGRGLTQRELAELAGVGVLAISNLETEKTRPTYGTAVAIAEALQVPNIELLFPRGLHGATPAAVRTTSEAAPAQDGSAKTPKAVGDDSES